jgi:hypothetical protein
MTGYIDQGTVNTMYSRLDTLQNRINNCNNNLSNILSSLIALYNRIRQYHGTDITQWVDDLRLIEQTARRVCGSDANWQTQCWGCGFI